MDAAATTRKLAIAAVVALLIVATALATGADARKRLRLTCDQTTDAIFQTAERYRAKYNGMGFTIEDAPYGFLVGSGCKNVGKLTRQGSAYMADVHHTDDEREATYLELVHEVVVGRALAARDQPDRPRFEEPNRVADVACELGWQEPHPPIPSPARRGGSS